MPTNEKEMLKIQYDYDKKKIWLEKGIIGVALVIAVIIGNFMVENYKKIQVREQFMLEKKLEAISLLRDNYFDMFRACREYVMQDSAALDQNIENNYEAKTVNLLKTSSRIRPLTSDKLVDIISYHQAIHIGIRQTDFKKIKDYGEFLVVLAEDFDWWCKKELKEELEIDYYSKFKTGFKYKMCTPEELYKMKHPTFLKNEHTKFTNWKTKTTK